MEQVDLSAPIHRIAGLINNTLSRAPMILLAVLVFAIFVFLARFVRQMIHRYTLHHRRHNIALLLGRLSQGLILFVGFMVALSVIFPSINAQSMVELFGIGSVAIGFAFRDILQNFLAGLLILINEPFGLGDRIKVKEFEGVVDDIETRATVLRADGDKKIVVPNALLFTESVIVSRGGAGPATPVASAPAQ